MNVDVYICKDCGVEMKYHDKAKRRVKMKGGIWIFLVHSRDRLMVGSTMLRILKILVSVSILWTFIKKQIVDLWMAMNRLYFSILRIVIIFLIRFEQWVSTRLGLVLCRTFLITLGSMGWVRGRKEYLWQDVILLFTFWVIVWKTRKSAKTAYFQWSNAFGI